MMNISFNMYLMTLRIAGILFVGLLFCSSGIFAAEVKPPASYAEYAKYLGESFSVYGGKGLRKVIALKLVEISKPREDGSTVQFSVRFQGPADYPLDKTVYTFERVDTGAFTLFLDPSGADSKNRFYEVVFNLLK